MTSDVNTLSTHCITNGQGSAAARNNIGQVMSTLLHCDDVDTGLDNTCEVIRQETVLFSTPETDYIIYD